jgi:hypothetical protein
VTLPAVFLPLDLTGISAGNFISGEYHQILSGVKTLIRPDFGSFYVEGFQLYGVSSQNNLTLMTEGVDYEFGSLDEWATANSDGEAYRIVLVKDTRFFTTFSVSYHAVGGVHNINWTRLYNQYVEASYGAPTPWANLFNVPSFFNPADHKNDALDVYGLEYIVNFLNGLKDAIHSSSTDQSRYAEIRTQLRSFESILQQANANLPAAVRQHIDNTGFAHTYTKAIIGLGLLSNYDFVPQVVNSVTLPAYASPQVLQYYTISNAPTYDPPTHIGLTNNPHNDTAEGIGLGLVHNLGFHASYSIGTGEYLTLLDPSATQVYLGPYAFVEAVSEYATSVYTTVTQPIIDAAVTNANSVVSNAQTILTGVGTTQASVNSQLSALQLSTQQVAQKTAQATALNNRYDVLYGNAVYSQTLIQLMLAEHSAFVGKKSVYTDGFFPVPSKIDSLYLWLSAENPTNTIMVDIDNNIRVTKLVDLSSYARVFEAPANTAPILADSQDVTNQVQGIRTGKSLHFTPGLCLNKTAGADIKMRPGMTVIALVRTGVAGSKLTLLAAPNAVQETAIYGYTPTGQSLAIRSGSAWSPLEAPANSTPAQTSGIAVGVVSADSESFCWLASSAALNYITYPRGVNTPASSWPSNNYDGIPLTQIGNANFGIDNEGEIAELLIFRRALNQPEINAVVEYLKLRYADSQALSVDFAAINAF